MIDNQRHGFSSLKSLSHPAVVMRTGDSIPRNCKCFGLSPSGSFPAPGDRPVNPLLLLQSAAGSASTGTRPHPDPAPMLCCCSYRRDRRTH
ncbi:hypothetical protein ASZ90_001469 [hydrocarbon metagenome]|uniref:Uncharacterized protein n=1 Tax=hydrocarbon metagenome TaxID=938273 RepID=A0A0W8G6P3_9ZZZZ